MSILKVAAIQNAAGVEVYTAKAWVNFNGTGTVAIRAAGNVSSITDNGTGDYTVNFTTAMADANYAASVTTQRQATNSLGYGMIIQGVSPTTTAIRVGHSVGSGLLDDASIVSVAIFR